MADTQETLTTEAPNALARHPTPLPPVSTLEITKLRERLPLIDERTIYEVVRAFISLREKVEERRHPGVR